MYEDERDESWSTTIWITSGIISAIFMFFGLAIVPMVYNEVQKQVFFALSLLIVVVFGLICIFVFVLGAAQELKELYKNK